MPGAAGEIGSFLIRNRESTTKTYEEIVTPSEEYQFTTSVIGGDISWSA
jgi:hypothetical protein